ncbi:CDP-diacylglycerol--inositol 3-phosphatidyltransferase-like [Pollicipes pollicipes]|uniref:CDP-diacylglycerol--inositol 3-phosphatidyltransferase-like n=1 Tax=Pollicipes pollicipes TaxID=41117 RepID=UPI001885A093|nr:CDP-diacylglycerol--inositol 3-phosphatidyltransferase-like [Pollicipes pollicipes]XP_037078245.1 CDP-diacylglycerol--inositol 3-phosphatidyltransferase-like [Pollicipes pollicipes]XP_037078246.1 CDP-diacylglycerol--inositol 3-phosphatidyltransferase-like [Pollicipes pollicipes]XP_037078247.1 CDP-diacylglycerol--inositol 3-phosphatidyltransferase-like [Pollicipes pollicipes]XP_037078248.1 CDP-diacylglycerol--inositol 3-phosphatidyltransferase-like [Pollicipes pollicipes]XP_037078249.1 CDP-d
MDNVFLFVPNLIGYGRVLLALLSLYLMAERHVAAGVCYVISGLLDALDGHAARLLNQSSRFGAMLDQLTDRCATMCLLACLCAFYPHRMLWFQLSMAIDISCHWIHLHVTTLRGRGSHKSIGGEGSALLRLYYTSRPLLFCMCGGNELFYSMLYLLHFTEGPAVLGLGLVRVLAWLSAPVAVAKSAIALVQGYGAWAELGRLDIEERAAAKAL